MNSHDPSSTSTRLENLSMEPDAAQLELGGRTVRIRAEIDPASFSALRSLYEGALVDFQARRQAESKPGWFSRMRSWLGRIFSTSEAGRDPWARQVAGRALSSAEALANGDGVAPDPRSGRRGHAIPPVLEPRDGLSADPRTAPPRNLAGRPPVVVPSNLPPPRPPEHPPQFSYPSRLSAEIPAEKSNLLPADRSPALRAVFGDRDGIHVIWNISPNDRGECTLEHHYPPESDLAGRLNDCYESLAQAGYKIVGLDLAPMRTVALEKKSSQISPEKSAVAAPSVKPVPADDAKKTPETKPPTWVMRLLPETPDRPGQVLVAPLESAENVHPLAATDRLVHALRAAADTSRAAPARLTCLRCAAGKSGMKVVAVGLGEGKGNEPKHWEEVSQWSDRQAEIPAPDKKPSFALEPSP